jgi:hypothetical protein
MPARSLALGFALAFALSGCADLAGHAPTVVERCRAAPVLLFREDAATGNRSLAEPTSQSFATLLNAGQWTRASFVSTPRNGTASWSARDGALHNVTLADAKLEFERGVVSTSRHDVNVTYAVHRTLGDAEYAAFCQALATTYLAMQPADENAACADNATATTAIDRAWLDDVPRERETFCGGGSDAARAFQAALAAVEANDTSAGAS